MTPMLNKLLALAALAAENRRLLAELAAERERCAAVAERMGVEWWTLYKTGRGPERADQHCQGMSDGAELVAAAIRVGPGDRCPGPRGPVLVPVDPETGRLVCEA